MLDRVLSVLAPHMCVGCGAVGTLLCDRCHNSLPLTVSRCYRCHKLTHFGRTCPSCRRRSSLFAVRVATTYEGNAKLLLWRFKFGRAQAAADCVAHVTYERCNFPADSLVTFVPTATSHVRRRGYDQTQLIVDELADAASICCSPLLRRNGQLQQRSAPRKERLLQLASAFEVLRPEMVRGKRIVIVDDVITTGGTLEAAASALTKAGASRVEGIVFAQA